MSTTVTKAITRRRVPPVRITAASTVLIAIELGLMAGFLDLLLMLVKKHWIHQEHYVRSARDFLWTVPLGHALFIAIPGLILAALTRFRAGVVPTRFGLWLLATFALWGAFLRMPMQGWSTLLLAAGLALFLVDGLRFLTSRPRLGRLVAATLTGMLCLLATMSSGWQWARESRVVANLREPPAMAKNVLLIVWDTVRARNLSLYGYPRDTTPNLSRWARSGVAYNTAIATAPWTYPSHCSFFTGRWPFELNAQWKFTLESTFPTLAEFLGQHGYQTAGFAANTSCCSHESGLNRGFTSFNDYPLTPLSFLGRTSYGEWILRNLFMRDDYHGRKWLRYQSRDAREINHEFLDWLKQKRSDRPFFAFLNYFDAHEPYVPPPGRLGRFGLVPMVPRDLELLMHFDQIDLNTIHPRDALMLRDRYDDCIAYLDEQLDALLVELSKQGVLENTLVIVTSDHGEEFGDHRMFGHGCGVYLDQVRVPLVMLSPDAPAGRVVRDSISLRDLPATVAEQVGLASSSPFPGRSLASYWKTKSGQAPPESSPALSEVANGTAFGPQDTQDLARRGFQFSLVAFQHHYVRDGGGAEQLFDMRLDPPELVNLAVSGESECVLNALRRMLFEAMELEVGTPEVEGFYLQAYREWLRTQVDESRENIEHLPIGE